MGLTALMIAAISGEVDCLKLLLQAGARPDLRERNGHTAVMLADMYGQHLVVKILKQYEYAQLAIAEAARPSLHMQPVLPCGPMPPSLPASPPQARQTVQCSLPHLYSSHHSS